jgi:hypothetical protein
MITSERHLPSEQLQFSSDCMSVLTRKLNKTMVVLAARSLFDLLLSPGLWWMAKISNALLSHIAARFNGNK